MNNKIDAYSAALRLLNYKMQSEYEILYKLRNRKYKDQEIYKVIEKLKQLNYINDKKLSEELFYYYKVHRLLSDKMIHYKLKLKGLYCNQHLTEDEEILVAEKIVNIKSKISKKYSENPKKLKEFLIRKGFSGKIIDKVIKDS